MVMVSVVEDVWLRVVAGQGQPLACDLGGSGPEQMGPGVYIPNHQDVVMEHCLGGK